MGLNSKLCLLLVSLSSVAESKKAFVLLGATGDNAYRPAGVWTGLYEAWCNGILDEKPTDLHAQVNQGHTVEEVRGKILATLQPFYATLKDDSSWKCMVKGGNCDPEIFYELNNLNVWEGIGKYNATGQAANMSYLSQYDEIIAYMSIPPGAYKEWTESMVKYWGGDKVHIGFEKPFGGGRNSLQDATALHKDLIDAGLSEANFHLTDHWLSFFMNEHLPTFRTVVEQSLGIQYGGADIERIVVTEYEARGFGGRGSFINGLGQVRDMVQSHLLQVLALVVMDPSAESLSAAKLKVFESLAVKKCELKQFEGLLQSKKMKYYPDFADSSFSRVTLGSADALWKGAEFVIQTGKAMDVNLYTIEIYQRGGPGVLTIDIGKEEVGLGDIKVQNWPLKSSAAFQAPLPGFGQTKTVTMTPNVDKSGNGYILRYNDPALYFPKPYAKIVLALVNADYGAAFVTWPECQKCWEIVTSSSPDVCLDPKPENVVVYIPSFLCDNEAPNLCLEQFTVKDLYDDRYSCTAQHDVWYKDIDFYKAKCHSPKDVIKLVV